MKDHLMPGHEDGPEVSHWDFQLLAGCGALYSSANDLLRYANLFFSSTNDVRPSLGGGEIKGDGGDNDLAAAVELATTVHYQNQKEDERIGLAWQIEDVDGTDIYSHDGIKAAFCIPQDQFPAAGLSRSYIYAVASPTPEDNYTGLVTSYEIKKPGTKHGIRIANSPSFREHVRSHKIHPGRPAKKARRAGKKKNTRILSPKIVAPVPVRAPAPAVQPVMALPPPPPTLVNGDSNQPEAKS
jgi:hypothetical protein